MLNGATVSCSWGEGCGERDGFGLFGSFCGRHAERLAEIRAAFNKPSGRAAEQAAAKTRQRDEIDELLDSLDPHRDAEKYAQLTEKRAKLAPKVECRLEGCDGKAQAGKTTCYRHRSVGDDVSQVPERCVCSLDGCNRSTHGKTSVRCARHPYRLFPKGDDG